MALLDCALSDIGYEGRKYTWSNSRKAPFIVKCRLDRVCSTSTWVSQFPSAFVEHLMYPGSDHVPVLLHLH